MRLKVLFIFLTLCFATVVLADSAAEKLYARVEQHLHSLKTLEIRYEVIGTALTNGTVQGRMIWAKPDRFFHDTPEWTVCETSGTEWRHLKQQNTLIWENSQDKSALLPENILFALDKDVTAEKLEERDGGTRILTLKSNHAESAGEMSMELAPNSLNPQRITFTQADGVQVQYQILQWNENIHPDSALFVAPVVPAENQIDFRGAGKGK